jgi:DNA-binding response OmpR family regulator
LIVDDERLILYSLSTVLRSERTEVRTVTRGREALREISERSYDLGMFDIHLPDMSGLEIMLTMRKNSPDARIIMMAGSEVDDADRKLIEENANLLVTKPFDVFQVKACVERILQERENIYREYDSFVQRLARERRGHARQSITRTVTYSTLAPDDTADRTNLTAGVVDISEAGMGIVTDCTIEPGRMLRFENALGRRKAVVRWSAAVPPAGSYRAGVQFLEGP